MNHPKFQIQMDRLECQWPRTYSARSQDFWKALQDYDDVTFEDAVTFCLRSERRAPLVPELVKAMEGVRARRSERARENSDIQNAAQILDKAAKAKHGDAEFVERCKQLRIDREQGKITGKQFKEGLALLDQAADLINPFGRDRSVELRDGRWELKEVRG